MHATAGPQVEDPMTHRTKAQHKSHNFTRDHVSACVHTHAREGGRARSFVSQALISAAPDISHGGTRRRAPRTPRNANKGSEDLRTSDCPFHISSVLASANHINDFIRTRPIAQILSGHMLSLARARSSYHSD